jgi:hypothetical protein
MSARQHLPLFGVVASLPLFALAMAHYPGGSDRDAAAPGFRLADNYVSALFQPLAINGMENAARKFAMPAILLLCLAVAYMFWAVSRQSRERATRKVIEIFGIGTAVYTFLGVNTRMHDLLVVIAAVFFGIAALGMLRMLHGRQRLLGVLGGAGCLALLLALSWMRHEGGRVDLAPMTEWALFALATSWLTFVYYSVTLTDA